MDPLRGIRTNSMNYHPDIFMWLLPRQIDVATTGRILVFLLARGCCKTAFLGRFTRKSGMAGRVPGAV